MLLTWSLPLKSLHTAPFALHSLPIRITEMDWKTGGSELIFHSPIARIFSELLRWPLTEPINFTSLTIRLIFNFKIVGNVSQSSSTLLASGNCLGCLFPYCGVNLVIDVNICSAPFRILIVTRHVDVEIVTIPLWQPCKESKITRLSLKVCLIRLVLLWIHQ